MINGINFIQVFGYAATILIAISLTMSSIIKLRIINFFGAVCFSTYGFIIGAYPVFLLNGFISVIDAYYLIQFIRAEEFFRVLELQLNSEYLSYFLKFHENEIQRFIPGFSYEPNENYHAMFVLRDAVPAGLVITEYLADDVIHIHLDFAAPGYRDFKMGKYVFAEIFKKKNLVKIYSNPGNPKHEEYLKRMGFVKTMLNLETIYCLEMK
jgi:hypothetical protein